MSHWSEAARFGQANTIIPLSNFGEEPAPVGSYHGVGLQGLHDMAGNVREWCFNAVDDVGSQRYILGGAWADPEYMFQFRNMKIPWDRSGQNGFRCVKYSAAQGSLSKSLFEPIERHALRDISQIKPPSDEDFLSYKRFYTYDHTELEAHIESIDESAIHWRKEKITFNAAYGNERIIAYLFIPKRGRSRYQPVIYVPTADAWRKASSEKDMRDIGVFDFIIQSGRAVIYPVYKGTYERRYEQGPPDHVITPIAHRNMTVQFYQDLARSVDYLESRGDMDIHKLAYLGMSRGAMIGPLWVALEERIRLAIFIGGGGWIWQDSPMPSADPIRFAPRIKVPTLMLNGLYDSIFPYDISQEPLFNFLGTAAEHKVHKIYPTGHGVSGPYREQKQRDILEWLDKYLGPVE